MRPKEVSRTCEVRLTWGVSQFLGKQANEFAAGAQNRSKPGWIAASISPGSHPSSVRDVAKYLGRTLG